MRRAATADEGSTGSKGTKIKVFAAVLVAAILVYFLIYFVARTPRAESPPMAAVEPQVADGELVDAADGTSVADPATEAVRRSPVVDEPSVDVPAIAATNVLRVILEGITEEDAQMTTVTLTGVDKNAKWPGEIQDSWPE